MNIILTCGVGSANTELAAFDKALYSAGIGNYNLIYLSSIIPPDSKVKILKPHNNEKDFGDKLYCVMARKDQAVFGKEAWAGIGWAQKKDGKGVFVEHTADSKGNVERLIKKSLKDVTRYREGRYGKTDYVIAGIECKNRPVCSVVAAVYKSEGWK